MKKVEKTRIVNIEGTDIFDNTLSFSYLETNYQNSQREVYFM
jgi:hypothetical protein